MEVGDVSVTKPLHDEHQELLPRVELLRGVGTRFRAVHAARGGPTEMTVELTDVDPPRRIASVTTASWGEIRGAVTLEPAGDATRMRWSWDVRPKGFARVLTPLVGVVGRREERACWEGLKRYLEDPAQS
jgi:hypothetical protein